MFGVIKNDKEIFITNNTAKNIETDKETRLWYDMRDEDITYIVVGAEKGGTKENPLKIIQRLIDRKTDILISGNNERTCRLPTIGGRKL